MYQDFIAIGGMTSPGVCEIEGAGIPSKWDERAGYGTDGATLVYTGRQISSFQAKFTLWNDDDLPTWNAFTKMLSQQVLSRAGKAWDIVHPLLMQIGITKVVVEDISQLTQMEMAAGRPSSSSRNTGRVRRSW